MTLQVGYAQTIITPSLEKPVFLAGFDQNRRATSVHDDLFARAMALRSERTTVILVAVDLIGFFRPDVQDVIQRVHRQAPDAEMIIAATHTHHGPDTLGLWGPDSRHSGVDPEYLALVKDKISQAALDSLQNLHPARLKSSSLHIHGLVKNARNPEIIDDELTLAQFIHPQSGMPLASLFIFPCHPEVLWRGNTHITADYPGYLRHAVEEASQAPCIFFTGALGGMMTPDVKDHSFEEAEAMGRTLAESGLSALAQAPVIDDLPVLQVRKREFTAKMTNPLFKLAIRRKLIPDVRNTKGEITTEVNLIKLGTLWLAAVPGELLPKLGLGIKAVMRQNGADAPGIIGLANDELGYLLPREDFRYPFNPFRPGKHYEETMSISRDIGSKVTEAVLGLLQP